jgi:uncharacterized protein (TIGR01777 family)
MVNALPKVWVQMSTAHIYGDPPQQVCTEGSAFGYGLAPIVAKAWEEALADGLPQGMREVRLRTSFVVGREGGALPTLAKIAKMGLGGRIGHGQQGFSWIHEDDVNSLVTNAITDPSYAGAYIISAPNPVSNAAFMKTVRKVLGVPIGLNTPEWLARLGARLIFRTDPELALYGRYVLPQRLMDEGYQFKFPVLETALRDLLK